MHFGKASISYPNKKAVLVFHLDKTTNVPSKVVYFGNFLYRGEIKTGNIDLTDFLKVSKMKTLIEGDTRFTFKNKNGNVPEGNIGGWIYTGDLRKTKAKGFDSYDFKEVFLFKGMKCVCKC